MKENKNNQNKKKSLLKQYPSDFQRFRYLFKVTGTKVYFLLLAVALSFSAAFFEGLSFGMLIPLVRSVMESGFGFMNKSAHLAKIIEWVSVYSDRPYSMVFIGIVVAIFVAASLKILFTYASSLCIAYQVQLLGHRLRKLIFSRYMSYGKLFFDQNNIGHLQVVATGFTIKISSALNLMHQMMSATFLLLFYLMLMTYISWQLTCASLLIFPILHYSIQWVIVRIKKTSKALANAQRRISIGISNIIMGIPLVKAYSREKQENARFSRYSDEQRKIEFSMLKKQRIIGPIQEMLMLFAVILLIVGMAYIYIRGKGVQLAGFLVYFVILKRGMTQFSVLGKTWGNIANVSGFLKEIIQIIDPENKSIIKCGTQRFGGLKKDIKYRNLDYEYLPNVPILQDLTFSVPKSKMTALVGKTGSGKTTVVSLLMRFYECPFESIFIDGVDIREFTEDSLRRRISWVSQETVLFNDTMRNNITYGLDRKISEDEVMGALKKSQLYEFVMNLPEKLNTFVGDRGVRLSGGEKQRLSIARALLKNAEILILDEATSSLDSKTERLIQEAINIAIKGRTSIVIAHRLSTIKNADKIIVLDCGRVVEEGNLQDLLARKEKFYELWQEQKFY